MRNPLIVQFVDARLKVGRARQHIKHLETLIQVYAGSGVHELFMEYKPELGKYQLGFRVTKALPPTIALYVGDAIHNLSAALDYVASEIVGYGDKRAHFPMHETRDQLGKSVALGKVKQAALNLEAVILDVIQPYEAGNRDLWALRKADNINKHRLLIPSIQYSQLFGVCLQDDHGKVNVIDNLFGITGAGILNAIRSPYPLHVTDHGQLAFSVVFGEGSYFDGSPLVQTLLKLADVVTYVIETLEAAYFGFPAKASCTG